MSSAAQAGETSGAARVRVVAPIGRARGASLLIACLLWVTLRPRADVDVPQWTCPRPCAGTQPRVLRCDCAEVAGLSPRELAALGVTVELNSATDELLRSLPGVGPVRACALARGRPYADVVDAQRARGVGPATLRRWGRRARVDPGVASAGVPGRCRGAGGDARGAR